MLHLEGDKQLPISPDQLWVKLTDLNFLAQCVPDMSEIREVQERSAQVAIRPGFSFVRGELQLTIEKLEESPPHMARLHLTTKGIGSSSEVEAAFRLEEQEGGTWLHWSADVKQLGGLLKAVPRGLIQAAAQKVLNELVAKLESRLLL